jgi:hypothetical protein
MWIGNLPVEIRNGTGVGGGRVVGWLPIVSYSIILFTHLVIHILHTSNIG